MKRSTSLSLNFTRISAGPLPHADWLISRICRALHRSAMAKSPPPSQRELGPYSSITRYCRNGHFAAIVENMSVEALDSDSFSPRKPERYESRGPMAALSGRHSKLVSDGKGCATICLILELSSCVSRFERSENL